MKKFVYGVIAGLLAGLAAGAVFIWQMGLMEPEVEMVGVEIHDTIYRDTLTLKVPVQEPVYYDAKWLRRAFETPYTTHWQNYEDGYEIEYPNFMERVVDYYKGGMTVREKYEALSASAVTKVLLDRAFTTAGNCGKNRLFFEKDIMLKPRTWLYLRVEFPSELTWAVDPLLHYVKDYEPKK